jgi:hypothetical protein
MAGMSGRRVAPFELDRGPTSDPLSRVPFAATASDIGAEAAGLPDPGRRKIWDLSKFLHCSIIGTCLSTAELRQLLSRLKVSAAETASDHDLHGKGVLMARRRDIGSKLLNKSLDKRHRLAINQFAKATTEDAVLALWQDALKRGDIPGAYWAALTHPATTDVLRRRVFGEVHMLSHLVGAANRADIRRLHQLEEEKAALEAKTSRQQAQLRDAVVTRDAKIRELSEALSRRISAEPRADSASGAVDRQEAALTTVIADIERRLSSEIARRESAERRLETSLTKRTEIEDAHRRSLRDGEALRQELAAAEESLTAFFDDRRQSGALDLSGVSVLYVGGRPHQIGQLRAVSERASVRFLHHDGGVDDRSGLLAGLVSRADIAMFPVDCISHEAALAVKRLCKQSGKPWVPLRTASVTAFLAAFRKRHASTGVESLS